MRRIARVNMV